MNKFQYLLRCILSIFQQKICPYCGGRDFTLIQRKYLVTTLLKCKNCGLNHRHPKDDPKFLEKFYQKDYHVKVEMMTDLPADQELEKLKANNFNELRDFSTMFSALFPEKMNISVVDYGCSWGYNVYKLKKSGLDAVGYELSVPRAGFGAEKLGVDIATDTAAIRTGNDIFFSSHTIEHLASIQDFIQLSKEKLNKEGVFVAICPNGSKEYQQRNPATYSQTWGSLHPNYLDIEFARFAFKNNPYLILTSDWIFDTEKIKNWDGRSQVVDAYREGYELLIIAKPNSML